MMDAASIENLSVSFNGHAILRDVSASFPASGISVLLGRSGSGKTTLLRAINRLNDEFPGCAVNGRVQANFHDGPVQVYPALRDGNGKNFSLRELRMRAGMLFQTPNLFPVSVYRNLAMPLQLVRGYAKNELNDRIREALAAVGLEKELAGRLDLPAERLSGGQQQRLCLARTLALEPEVLLLDEPTASLDVHAAANIEELLLRLAQKYAMIMVSHSLTQARRMGERIFICENGRISDSLASAEVTSDELLARLL